MPLFFLHPIYLFGLIAASVPLLIHLLNRRRRKRMRFPAVRFILLSQRRTARTYRLRHWLILALRTAAVLFLVLLMAHPIFETGVGLFASGNPRSLVVILDNSLSMKWSRGGEGFQQAKDAARRLIASLKERDQAGVIATDIPEKGQPSLKKEKATLLRELDGIQLAAGAADFARALGGAYALLKNPAPQKEIWLITDLALTGWDRFTLSALGQYDPLVSLKILQVEKKGAPLNATIKGIKSQNQEFAVGLPIQLEAALVNFTDQEIKELLVQLYVDEQKKEQRLVSLPAQREVGVSFRFSVNQPGAHHGQVALRKEGLAGNTTVYFALQIQDRPKVLVVDGDPQTSLVQSETFFLTRALNPVGERDSSPFLPTAVIPDGLSSVPLESYQVLIFCNVPVISEALRTRLRDYLLRGGGGVLVFLGDRVQVADYNLKLFQSSPPLLPARLREKKILPDGRGEKIEKIDVAHPALQAFSDQLLKGALQSARIRGYFPTDSPDPSALLALTSGDPLLIEKRIGRGRLLLFTTAADRDWSDLPLKTAYLPLIQALVSYLSGGKMGAVDGGIAVGDAKTLSFPPPEVGKALRILKPDGREREITLMADGERASVSFQENDLPGIYRLSLSAARGDVALPQLYAVNPPFLESRLETISERELRAKLDPIRPEIHPIESLKEGGKRIDLALPLLLLLIVTLLSEGWLAQRMYG